MGDMFQNYKKIKWSFHSWAPVVQQIILIEWAFLQIRFQSYDVALIKGTLHTKVNFAKSHILGSREGRGGDGV